MAPSAVKNGSDTTATIDKFAMHFEGPERSLFHWRQSFQHAQDMVRTFGTLHLVALYHGQPLALDSSKIQRKKLIGGYYLTASRKGD